MNVLIVDDERMMVKGLKLSLEQSGIKVNVAYDGKQAMELLGTEAVDLILLDIMLPEIDGVTLCKMIRQKTDIPIIMLTAKDDFVDKVLGLELGADDYITKPFNTRELLARINAVYRRYKRISNYEETIRIGDIEVCINSRTLTKGNKEIDLTNKEFDLLYTLVKSPGRVFTRDNLFQIVWNEQIFDTRTVDVHISNLREKIETDPTNPSYILTKWGVGYYFRRERS